MHSKSLCMLNRVSFKEIRCGTTAQLLFARGKQNKFLIVWLQLDNCLDHSWILHNYWQKDHFNIAPEGKKHQQSVFFFSQLPRHLLRFWERKKMHLFLERKQMSILSTNLFCWVAIAKTIFFPAYFDLKITSDAKLKYSSSLFSFCL